jgi:phosphotransferase system HPr-like phosphotransfer protein
MKAYATLNVTDPANITVVSEGDTRNEAFSALAEVAEIGNTYVEIRTLGNPIQPKERKAVTLSRVTVDEEEAVEEQEEAVEEQEEVVEEQEEVAEEEAVAEEPVD